MSRERQIAPVDVIRAVEMFIETELELARGSGDRAVLDEEGIYLLHALVAEAYAAGWRDGVGAQSERDWGRHRRERAAAKNAGADQ